MLGADRFSMTRPFREGGTILRVRRRQDEALSADVAQLNGLLGVGISFRLVSGDGDAGGMGPGGHRGGASWNGSSIASGVLTLGEKGNARRAASRPVALSRRRRDRLLALASCLAECAMDLGIGIGVYRNAGR